MVLSVSMILVLGCSRILGTGVPYSTALLKVGRCLCRSSCCYCWNAEWLSWLWRGSITDDVAGWFPFLVVSVFVLTAAFFCVGRCCCFLFELVDPRSCCCFNRTLGGWLWSFLLSWLHQDIFLVSWGLFSQGKLGRRWCWRALQRVWDSNLKATFGHMSIATDDTVRPIRSDAAPRPLHTSPLPEE